MAKIIIKGGVEFLEVNVFGDSKHLNPHLINISQIRYIREYTEAREGREVREDRKAWAIFAGRKMMPTYDDIGLNRNIPGDTVRIGKQEFECSLGSSLTEKINNCLFFINYQHIVHLRRFVSTPGVEKDSPKKENKDNPETVKFALINTDDWLIKAEIDINKAHVPVQ